MKTVLIFDPYPISQKGFLTVLKKINCEIRIIFVSQIEALAQVGGTYKPSVIVLTINTVNKRNPLLFLKLCRTIYPGTPVVLYDEEHYPGHLNTWRRYGISGFLFKSEPAAVLGECIENVISGNKYLSPEGWMEYFGARRRRRLSKIKPRRTTAHT